MKDIFADGMFEKVHDLVVRNKLVVIIREYFPGDLEEHRLLP